MSFIKRACLYCRRQKFRTTLLFFILTLIASFWLTGLAIRDAAVDAAAGVQTAIGGKLLLDLDTDGHMGSGQANEWGGMDYAYDGDMITPDIVEAVKEVDGVVDYNAEGKEDYYGAGVNFQYLPASLNLSYTPYGESSLYTATLSSEKCSDFQSGRYRLVEGRHITPEDTHVCLLSRELADYNGLSVGDKVQMYSLDSDSISEFEIVGIFDGTEGTSGNALTVDEIPANCGYIDYATLFELFGDEVDGYSQLTIYAEDPAGIQNVYDKIAALPELKGKTLKLSIDTEEYDTVSTPLQSLEKLVNTTILIISLVSTVILTLLLTMWIRGRKREIGILLAAGKSKANVLAQFFAETALVAVAAFAASVPLGHLAAARAGSFLAATQADGFLTAAQAGGFPAVIQAGGFLADQTAAGAVHLSVQMELRYLPPLCLLGACLIIISVSTASWNIIRLNPRDILTKTS